MKTKFFAIALAGVFALGASAQEVKSSANLADQPGKNVTFQRNGAGDNWFITLRGGTNLVQPFGKYQFDNSVKTHLQRLGWGASLGFGKWFTPYFASRVVVDFNNTRDPFLANPDKKTVFSPDGKGSDIDFYSLNPHIDFMFNPGNYFGAYNASRGVSFVPFVGVGVFSRRQSIGQAGANSKDASKWLEKINYAVSANLGFDLAFRLGSKVDLVLAPQVVFSNVLTPRNANAVYTGNEMLAKVDLGFNFNLGKSDFEAIEPMDYALLNSLQSEINSLRSQNTELSKRPVRCPECPQVPAVTEKVKSENVVYFRIGSSKVDRNQKINIFNTAEFVKSNNVPVTVIGYADAKTGSSNYNMKLSERRAREVARILTDEYGVPSSQITIDYKGDGVQPYAENAWNRVVIMTAEK